MIRPTCYASLFFYWLLFFRPIPFLSLTTTHFDGVQALVAWPPPHPTLRCRLTRTRFILHRILHRSDAVPRQRRDGNFFFLFSFFLFFLLFPLRPFISPHAAVNIEFPLPELSPPPRLPTFSLLFFTRAAASILFQHSPSTRPR